MTQLFHNSSLCSDCTLGMVSFLLELTQEWEDEQLSKKYVNISGVIHGILDISMSHVESQPVALLGDYGNFS